MNFREKRVVVESDADESTEDSTVDEELLSQCEEPDLSSGGQAVAARVSKYSATILESRCHYFFVSMK